LGLLAVALVVAALVAPAGASYIGEWGKSGAGDGEFRFPASVATDATGSVYVTDSQSDRVQRFTEAGEFLEAWGGPGSAPGQFSSPEGIAVDKNGNVYVADRGNSRVQKLSPTGAFIAQFGGAGSGRGLFQAPVGVAVDKTGDVFVVDAALDLVQKFSAAGSFLAQWGGAGTGPGQFRSPDGIVTDPAGNVYVADSEDDRVQKFDGNGAFLAQWGGSGAGPGQLKSPAGLGSDGKNVYVADRGNDRIEKFSQEGEFLSQFGGSGDGPGQFDSPVAIAASPQGKIFVADAGNDRIQAFGRRLPPVYGSTVNVGKVAGAVTVKLPGEEKAFDLTTEVQVPVGTIIDTTFGKVNLTAAKNPSGTLQSARFFDGRFKVLQPRHGRPITVLKLKNPVACGRTTRSRASASGSKDRGLWGSGKGNFRSVGRHGSATVTGTIWWAQDRCDGTLFRVKRGVVTIRDFTLHRKLKLHAGERYLAAAG
jgi:DNA-binding beta-propeller fold protein YncE